MPSMDPFGMAGNPEQMQQMAQQMMNNPMMQQMMNNPDVMRMFMESNPQVQALMQSNPEIGAMLRDPQILRQTMQVEREQLLG